jgi:hypothetical protein
MSFDNFNTNNFFDNQFGTNGFSDGLGSIDSYVRSNPLTFFFNCVILIMAIIFLSLKNKNSSFLAVGVFLICFFAIFVFYLSTRNTPIMKGFFAFFKNLSPNQIFFLVAMVFALLVFIFIRLKSYVPPPSEKQYLKMTKFETDNNNRVQPGTQEHRMGALNGQNEKDILDGETLLFAYDNQLDDEIPNEYTYSFWIKVAPENFNVSQKRWKPILLKGVSNNASQDPFTQNPGNPNPNINYRCVPAGTSEEEEEESSNVNVRGSNINTTPPLTFNINAQSIFDNKNPGVYLAPQENKMNISVTTSDGGNNSIELYDIPLDTWFCVTIVLENKSLDCYIDGKLEQTITLTGFPQSNNGNLYRTPFFGKMRYLRYNNVALNPDAVFKRYEKERNAINKMT